ncbi:trypsin-4-like [Belonocnema kinseyi]|uniref:trypsin-4-like n=1 Tax=Belonocnema kinseyi TaxID=2817044 RepID=UPI00143CD56B|nr:trypsin-4-like [Belonocnema kinseyi]
MLGRDYERTEWKVVIGEVSMVNGEKREWCSEEQFSTFHMRQKRIINLRKQGDGPVHIASVPYIVNIRKENISDCAGSILSAVFVLTAYDCVFPSLMEDYSILSGSALRNSGTRHSISRRIVVRPNQELVLLEVSPRIDFHQSPNRPIRLFTGFILYPVYAICSGWGCTHPGSTCS